MVGYKVTHYLLDIYEKNISLMKINNIILVLHTDIILPSLLVTYFFVYVIQQVFLLHICCNHTIYYLLDL